MQILLEEPDNARIPSETLLTTAFDAYCTTSSSDGCTNDDASLTEETKPWSRKLALQVSDKHTGT